MPAEKLLPGEAVGQQLLHLSWQGLQVAHVAYEKHRDPQMRGNRSSM